MNLSDAWAETKVCRRCGEARLISDFGYQRLNKDGLKPYCRPCQSKISREWQLANREKHARQKHALYIKHYAKRFSVWKLKAPMDGLLHPYGRALQADPCAYCGGPAGHLDHIVPVPEGTKRGVTSRADWENLTAACQRCNNHKERASLLEFMGWPRGWLA